MSKEFAALLRSFTEESFQLEPDDPEAEWQANTVWFGVPSGRINPALVAAALVQIGQELRLRLRDARPPLTFYAWYDECAGQLRCSLGSVGAGALPFRGSHVVVDRPDAVIERLTADPHPGIVLWSELVDAGPAAKVEQFPVFAVPIVG